MLKSALLAKLSTENKKVKKNGDPFKLSSASPIAKATKKSKKQKINFTPLNLDDSTLEKLNTEKMKKLIQKKVKVVKNLPQNSEFDTEITDIATRLRMDPKTVQKAVEALLKFTSENPKLKNRLFENDLYPVFLQINTIKVPPGHPRIMRIPLRHSLLTPDSEICLIVGDLKGIPNRHHDRHVEHYEKLLQKKGITNIKKIMTFHEFRTEYETFEMRNRLVELYDMFLVEGKIGGKVVKKCGKVFYQKRKVPTSVKMRASKLKTHFEQVLRKTPLYVHGKGDSFVVEVGHSKMDVKDIAENVFCIGKTLEKDFPGGFENIRSLNLFAHRGLHIPIYTTLKNQNEVDVSKNGKMEESVEEVFGELTTKLNSGVRVKPTGEVEVYKLNKNE